jgi:hypothetical protein
MVITLFDKGKIIFSEMDKFLVMDHQKGFGVDKTHWSFWFA